MVMQTSTLEYPPKELNLLETRLVSMFPYQSLCSREKVIDSPTPPSTTSETGRLWQPVPFGTILKSMDQALEQSKRRVLDSLFSITKDGMRMMALYAFEGLGSDYETQLLWSSHDKSSAIRIACGTIYCACFNGIVSAEIVIRTKHTRNVFDRLPKLIGEGVGLVNELRVTHQQREVAYKGATLNGDARSALLDCVDAGGLTRTNFWQARAMYEKNEGEHWPKEYHDMPNTVFRLYQAATTPGMPMTQASRMCSRLHNVLDTRCNFDSQAAIKRVANTADTEVSVG